ncbi:hypothetical protein KCP69_03275 [Salmonella enterica subsp. enterica]|nr:hypothetical protein KCP69_03275 [Salmonella enterica subsp. enterica]
MAGVFGAEQPRICWKMSDFCQLAVPLRQARRTENAKTAAVGLRFCPRMGQMIWGRAV